jgi:hypothetical protein
MAAGWPTKVTYANGDVYSASDVNDTNGTLNYIDPTSATDGQVLTRDNASAGKVKWSTISVAESLGFTAGKNKIINGDFGVNQRAFSSTTTDATFGFDRFRCDSNGGATFSAQVFTPGAAPVAGYESANYLRIVTTGQSGTGVYTVIRTNIEDVRNFAGQTVTLSFWAKAATGTPKIASDIRQVFGSGGSPSATVNTYGGSATLSTSWARYSLTVAIPSISGKTIGTTANTSSLQLQLWVSAGSDFNSRTGSLGIQSNTFEIWGIQMESGSTATAFQTATGTIQGELAACQRYYQVANYGFGKALSASDCRVVVLWESMRTAPSYTISSLTSIILEIAVAYRSPTGSSQNSISGSSVTNGFTEIAFTGASGMTTGNLVALAGSVNLSAEL